MHFFETNVINTIKLMIISKFLANRLKPLMVKCIRAKMKALSVLGPNC